MRTRTMLLRAVPAILLLLLALAVSAGEVKDTVLPNGLRVLIKPSHAAPVAVVDVWYKVGSRNETAGMTGSSHLLEHMTYRGTTAFDKDQMRNLSKRNGAIDNGATFYDYTTRSAPQAAMASDRARPARSW